MENKEIMENEVIEETTATPSAETTNLMTIEDNTVYDGELVPAEEASEESGVDPKIVLAVGAGAAALLGLGTAAIVKTAKKALHKDDKEAAEDETEQPKKAPKSKKQKIKVKRGEKLSLVDRITGYTHPKVDPEDNGEEEETPEEQG